MPPLVAHVPTIFFKHKHPPRPCRIALLLLLPLGCWLLALSRHISPASVHAHAAAGGGVFRHCQRIRQSRNGHRALAGQEPRASAAACKCERRGYLLIYPSVPTRHSEWLLELNTVIYTPTLLLTPLRSVVLGSARTPGPPVPAGHRPRSPFHCPREETTPALSCLSAHVTSLEISTRRWNRGHTLGVGPDIKRRI